MRMARLRHPRRSAGKIAVIALLAPLALCARAGAVIHPASAVDGPANDILEVDGAALAPDGSGGVVYRKQVNGVAHVFAVSFVGGRWGAPAEVDAEDLYGASQPAIAAGEGGRLLVVWVQPRNVNPQGVTLYELMSASLQPGASAFGQAIIVDPNVGEPYTGDVSAVDPALAMTRSGLAYVVYRAITNDCDTGAGDPPSSSCPPNSTDKLADVRAARFNYLTWSSLGAVNRAPQIALRDPTRENMPAIGISLNGSGIVAWQEPGSDHVARIWVRRLFGTVQGNVLQASPESVGGRAVTSDADAPTLADGPFGEARIVYRIHGSPGSAIPVTRLYLNTIASEITPHSTQFEGSAPLPGAQGGLGPPSAAMDQKGNFHLAWTQDGAVQELTGGTHAIGAPVAIGTAGGTSPTTINPAGGGTTAWVSSSAGLPAVAVREDYPQGAFQFARLAGDVPGQIAGLALGGNGQGDALLGFTQGPPGRSEVVGDFVQAPPAPFVAEVPEGWVRARSALVNWEPAPDAVAGVTYAVYLDGGARVRGLTGLSARLGPAGLGDGIHHVQVLATDAAGQQTMSPEADLKIDANPPIVRLGRFGHGRGVRVTVRDAASGVNTHATSISFGDGHRAGGHARLTHVYRRAGTYTITARVRDRAGNAAVVHLRVRVG
jgi:hypothetical protein